MPRDSLATPPKNLRSLLSQPCFSKKKYWDAYATWSSQSGLDTHGWHLNSSWLCPRRQLKFSDMGAGGSSPGEEKFLIFDSRLCLFSQPKPFSGGLTCVIDFLIDSPRSGNSHSDPSFNSPNAFAWIWWAHILGIWLEVQLVQLGKNSVRSGYDAVFMFFVFLWGSEHSVFI